MMGPTIVENILTSI